MSAPVCPMPSTMRLVLPQMCSRNRNAQRAYGRDEPLFKRQYILRVELWPNQRSRRIPYPNQRGSRCYLLAREFNFHANDEIEKRFHKRRVVEEIEHECIEATQVGAHGARPFHPPFDNVRLAGTLREEPARLRSGRASVLARRYQEAGGSTACSSDRGERGFRQSPVVDRRTTRLRRPRSEASRAGSEMAET